MNAAAEDVLPKEAVSSRFVDRVLHAMRAERVFTANVEESTLTSCREPSDRHRLDDREGIAVEQHAILERTGLGFVGVADQIVWARRLLGDGIPLAARRKGSATAPHELRVDDLANHLVRPDLDRLAKRIEATGVAVGRDV